MIAVAGASPCWRSIALPSFMDSIRKSRRSEAFAALSAVQQAQERWRSNRSAYTTELTAKPGDGLGLPDTSAKDYYAISIDDTDETSYETTATAKEGTSQFKDGNCARLRIRVDGGDIFYGSASADGNFDESPSNPCWAR